SAVQANEEKTNKGDDEGFLRGYEDDEMDASTFTEDDETGNDLDEEDTGLANEDENKEEDRYKGENI
ncbi:MAG TPA: hypothetical protein VK152_01880, partial [Paludibacter sp.]|nr:hypothetical protein [Paludibacter sp.]